MHAELTMGSGKRHFRNVGILRTSGAQVIQAKRDGQNAFRQVQTAPCDCWATGLFWPKNLKRTVEAIMAAETDEEADAMIDAVLPMHAVDDAVMICRCEEVTAGELRAVVAHGCQGPNQAKAFLRCGMGPCQGRLCGLTVTEVLATARRVAPEEIGYYRIRPPIKPVTIGELASLGDGD